MSKFKKGNKESKKHSALTLKEKKVARQEKQKTKQVHDTSRFHASRGR